MSPSQMRWRAKRDNGGLARSNAHGTGRGTEAIEPVGVGEAARSVGARTPAGSTRPWVRHGPVDLSSCGSGDPTAVRDRVLRLPCVEAAPEDGMDAPAAGATSQRAGRGADCELGSRGLASAEKGALSRGGTVVSVDESGFSQKPSVRSTWAPRGCTPVIADHMNWKRVSVIWDRLAAHRSKLVCAYITDHTHWLRVESLPPYAPELNPVEQMWANLQPAQGKRCRRCGRRIPRAPGPAH